MRKISLLGAVGRIFSFTQRNTFFTRYFHSSLHKLFRTKTFKMEKHKERFELLYSGLANETVPVKKFKSKRTSLKVVVADVAGPLVHGFFCLATEASDDDGLPHTLEHVIFLGSENHPYKGVLDKLATRCLSSGTNAWTDRDHTCYTITTAGFEGFLNLLPVYLDHILYPILSDAAFVTEVHHINGEGKDGGVVYSEMQATENTGDSKTLLEMLRAIYPQNSGYRFETGGILENMRDSLTNEKVKDFHRKFYKPENLCLIITGKVDLDALFQKLSVFEEKIILKGLDPNFKRPWMSAIAPLTSSVYKTVKFPSDEEDEGLVTVAWRGPDLNDQLPISAFTILMEYLTDSPIALLNTTFVEIDEPYCGSIDYSIHESKESVVSIEFDSVAMDRIHEIQPKLIGILNDLASGSIPFDEKRIQTIVHNKIIEIQSQMEDDPHETLASSLIGDFLYGRTNQDTEGRIRNSDVLRMLLKEGSSYYKNLLREYLTSHPVVTIVGEPSSEAVKELTEQEERRIEARKLLLKTDGLNEKNAILTKSLEENDRSPPENLFLLFSVPDIKSLQYHYIASATNCKDFLSIGVHRLDEDLLKIPCCFQLDDIKTSFVTMNICIDAQKLPSNLVPYLPLYTEVLFESSMVKDNVKIPYEVVVEKLTEDAVEYGASLGLNGSRFSTGEFSSFVVISIKVELKKFVTGVKWCADLMNNMKFSAGRVTIVAKKMLSDLNQMKRDAQEVVDALSIVECFTKGSTTHASSMLTQLKFLKDFQTVKKSTKHLKKLEDIQQYFCNVENVYIHMATDVSKLKEYLGENQTLSSVWKENFVSSLKSKSGKTDVHMPSWNPKKDSSFVKPLLRESSHIAGIGSTDSSYLIKLCPCMDDFNHPDVPALLVFCHFINILEGPMWKLIRGKGLAYSFSLIPDFSEGQLSLRIERSVDLYEAYKQAFEFFQDLINGKILISQLELECAKCQGLFELTQAIQTPIAASKHALICFMRKINLDYCRVLLEKMQQVTSGDLQAVAQKYVSRLIDPNMSRNFVSCHHKEVTKLSSSFQELCKCKFTTFKSANIGELDT